MFEVGKKMTFSVDDEMGLLQVFEDLVAHCLELGDVFAIADLRGAFVQLYLDTDHHLTIETTVGNLADHAGFIDDVPDFSSMAAGSLPASWHARHKMAASAFTRSLVDGEEMTFPATLNAVIVPTGADRPSEPVPPLPPHTDGAPTFGFLFPNRPRGEFVDEFAPALGLETRRLEVVLNALQRLIEADYGPLNRIGRGYDADVAAVLGSAKPPTGPNELWVTVIDGAVQIRPPPS